MVTVRIGSEMVYAHGYWVGTQPFTNEPAERWFVARWQVNPGQYCYDGDDPNIKGSSTIISYHASLAEAETALDAILQAPNFYSQHAPEHPRTPYFDPLR